MQNKMTTSNFWKLLNEVSIEIPKIQRDYAQGREDQKTRSIRNTFLGELLEIIAKDKTKELDFIYGANTRQTVDGREGVFIPLDGQQRLTTLFLIYWYFSVDRTLFKGTEGTSRFTYETRVSSRLFCDGLINCEIDYSVSNLIDLIKDSSWYSSSWDFDPTIKSMLVMIDAIHTRCKSYSTDERDLFWNRLTSATPPITFQLLYLDDYSLTDELYIKMNARGRTLTEFENFKSFLDEEVDVLYGSESDFSVSWKEHIDGVWTDLFWKYRNKTNNSETEIDQEYLRLFKNVLSIHLITNEINVSDEMKEDIVLNEFFEDSEDICSSMINTLNDEVEIPNYIYKKTEVLTTGLFEKVSSILNNLVVKEDEQTVFVIDRYWEILKDINFNIAEKGFEERNKRDVTLLDVFVSGSSTNRDRVLFHAFALFIVKHGVTILTNDSLKYEFSMWMRVVRNLAENRQYNSYEDFKNSIESLSKLINADHILEYFANPTNVVDGFATQQIEEERIKAILLLKKHDVVTEQIRESEEHGYFRGQIDFLLSYSEISISNVDDIDLDLVTLVMAKYKTACEALFDNEGLRKISTFLFERALLSFGDYTFSKSSNWSFLVDNDRDISWKRMLDDRDLERDAGVRRNLLKDLIDHKLFNVNDLEGALQSIIDLNLHSMTDDDWRKGFVQYSDVLGYLGNSKMMRWERDNVNEIYLLKGMRMSGAHAEYRSYVLYCEYMRKQEEIHPFTLGYYAPSGNEWLACMYMEYPIKSENNIVIDVHYLQLAESEEYSYQLSIKQRKRTYKDRLDRYELENNSFDWDEIWKSYLFVSKTKSEIQAKLKEIQERIVQVENIV